MNSRIIMLKVRIVVVLMVMIIVTLMVIIMKITKSKKDLQTGTPHHRIADPRTNIEMQVELTSSAQRVGFFNIGSGRVLDKIPGSGSGSGRVGVSKNTIRYFRVSFFLSGISGYFRVCRVFSGISGFTHTY